MLIAFALAAALLNAPIPTPPIFVAGDYALTFHTPPDTTTCALPADFVGSNHGTVIFLQPPKDCGGVGYPSSSRSFSENVPRIEVFYAYWLGDPGTGPKPCHRVIGRIQFIAKARKLCPDRSGPGSAHLRQRAIYRRHSSVGGVDTRHDAQTLRRGPQDISGTRRLGDAVQGFVVE